jgi:ribonucleoside-diphosphate reductase alpha chain
MSTNLVITDWVNGKRQRVQCRSLRASTDAGTSKRLESADPEDAPTNGLTVPRFFTHPGDDPYTTVDWERRDAAIVGEDGEVVFEQSGCEVPSGWSQLATNVVASKYFRGKLGTPEREHSVRQLVGRVVGTLREWGAHSGYFRGTADAETFAAEVTHLLLHQKLSFNSPVWFNVGVESAPQQVSACFINSVEDSMESIMDLAKTETMLFKGGSGTGTNFSRIRSSQEPLTGGGTASGPVSFMKGYDSFAGVVKSGGKTRRAAKMVILDVDHPDIRDFVGCKAAEEKKAWALIEAGYDGSFNVPGGAYDSVAFQNANHSVRVSDDFMRAALDDGPWETRTVCTGEPFETLRARDLLREMAEAAHLCGDPGIQFDTTINRWNPVPASGRISASNPCSEFMFLDDTACNLASLNLMAFRTLEGGFDVRAFRRAVALAILAQEIMVDHGDYPTPRIAENSHRFRPLGLGYANLGALLMSYGLPYDGDAGRSVAAAVTSLLCGEAYRTSAEIAEALGPFQRFEANREAFLQVIALHRDAAERLTEKPYQPELFEAAREIWSEVLERGQAHGFRNAQVTVLAPTGTIAFMMDCDTTGVEPDLALVKSKKLAGGGVMKIVNGTVPLALEALGHGPEVIREIVAFVDEHGTIEGAPGLRDAHLPVFDCALRPVNGQRSIHWKGHLRMMAAVQPFLSGAISKTVNLPSDATVEDVTDAYVEAWRLGLKALAVYRDGSKRTQPLASGPTRKKARVIALETALETRTSEPAPGPRHKLPDERQALTHKFSIAGHEGYITTGLFEDGSPGEIFLRMAKEGSTISGLMDTIATMTSLLLQYGVSLEELAQKFSHTRFEPAGFTNNREIPMATSVPDYVFRYLAGRFRGEAEVSGAVGVIAGGSGALPAPAPAAAPAGFVNQADAPPCVECGAIMVRNGACHKCLNCGAVGGCS